MAFFNGGDFIWKESRLQIMNFSISFGQDAISAIFHKTLAEGGIRGRWSSPLGHMHVVHRVFVIHICSFFQ